jgi:hypothetical protein
MARKRTEDIMEEFSKVTGVDPTEALISEPSEGASREVTEDIIDQGQAHSIEGPSVTVKLGLNDAADILLSKLEPSIRNYAFEVADLVLKIPRWQLVLGTLMSQYQSGALVAPYIDPSWQSEQIIESAGVCKRCKKTFTPKRIHQVYCSNECGSLAIREENESRARP